ncbi:MAG: hypothetical protein F4X40_03240 [Chloroflexi bacterium]|nr:hypothetical protein [Chloroflexota bacterium]
MYWDSQVTSHLRCYYYGIFGFHFRQCGIAGSTEANPRLLSRRGPRNLGSARVQTGVLREEGTVNKLFVRERGTQIKIEVTPVLRGCVFEPREKAISNAIEEQFGFAAIQVVSF